MPAQHQPTLRFAVLVVFLGACGPSSSSKAPTATKAPTAPPRPAGGTAHVSPPSNGPEVFRAVRVSYSHNGAPMIPQWVLLAPTTPPAQHRKIQHWRPHGSTVSGQPEVAVGTSTPVDRWVTLVTSKDAIAAHLTTTAPLGMRDHPGSWTWWTAAPLPKDLKAPWARGEVVALAGKRSGLKVLEPDRTQKCGPATDLRAITGHQRPVSSTFCFANGVTVMSVRDEATSRGAARLDSFRTIVFQGTRRTQVRGYFVRLLHHHDRLLLIVNARGPRAHVLQHP